jgi:hypothetical protein
MEGTAQAGLTYSRNGKTYFSPISLLIAPDACKQKHGIIDLKSIEDREFAFKLRRLKKKHKKGV